MWRSDVCEGMASEHEPVVLLLQDPVQIILHDEARAWDFGGWYQKLLHVLGDPLSRV